MCSVMAKFWSGAVTAPCRFVTATLTGKALVMSGRSWSTSKRRDIVEPAWVSAKLRGAERAWYAERSTRREVMDLILEGYFVLVSSVRGGVERAHQTLIQRQHMSPAL